MRATKFEAVIWHSLIGVALVIAGCTPEPPPSTQNAALFQAAAVAAPDVHGTEVSKSVLERGGNAVDAAVATAFALAVTLSSRTRSGSYRAVKSRQTRTA